MRALVVAAVVTSTLALASTSACRRSDDVPGAMTPPTTTTTTTIAKKTLTLGVTSEPSSLCPLFSDGAPTAEVQGLIFRELVQSTPAGKIGDLAARVPSLGDGAHVDVDGTFVVDWTLRDDVRWSDGVPVTSKDVVAGWTVARDAAQAAASSPQSRRPRAQRRPRS